MRDGMDVRALSLAHGKFAQSKSSDKSDAERLVSISSKLDSLAP